jgi:hypothetical protein
MSMSIRIMQGAVAATMIAFPAWVWAAQPHNATPAGTVALPNLLFEVDYAVAGGTSVGNTVELVDTIVSIGLASNGTVKCDIQVAWFDWNGVGIGFSGDGLGVISNLFPGETLEFTTSNNVAAPLAFFPFDQNVFRSTAAAFEGHAQIRSSCPTSDKIRADAEFVTLAIPSGAQSGTVNYKVINISRPAGIVGY